MPKQRSLSIAEFNALSYLNVLATRLARGFELVIEEIQQVMAKAWHLVPSRQVKGIRWLAIALLAMGIVFRFANLDLKVYWVDETITSWRVSGYSEAQILAEAFTGDAIALPQLQQYQRFNPDSRLSDTLNSLATEAPQHPPLYYILTRFWIQVFGSSIAATRSLAALISLLAFPAIYWLCQELFACSLTGAMAVALLAVSPFHLLYAQEAREYSLWTVAILVSSAALLRALRRPTSASWGIYALTMALGFYSFLFHAFVAFGHSFYVLFTEKVRFTPRFRAYLVASLAAIFAFTPWIVVILLNWETLIETSSWTTEGTALLQKWLINPSYVFFDLNQGTKYLLPRHIILLLLIIYAFYFLCRKAQQSSWLFVVILAASTSLPLMIPDVIFVDSRSTIERYVIPSYLGIQLAVAYLLAQQSSIRAIQLWKKRFWQGASLLLILAGIVSCLVILHSEFWWNKSPNKHFFNEQIAEIINRSERPLLIADDSTEINDMFVSRILTLSYDLDPKVHLKLVLEAELPPICDQFSEIYLFSPTEELLQKVQANYQTEPVFEQAKFKLFQITSPIQK